MNDTAQHPGPLAGLNVLEFGHYYAGPMVGMTLADQGANVIRVVRPGEPELGHEQYRLINRGKKLLTLDLKTAKGIEVALSLMHGTDVLVENFRPGVMSRLGLGYDRAQAANPGLIYLSLPGFASTDKVRASVQAWDGVIAAAACMYDSQIFRRRLKFPPVYTWVPLTSTFGAMHGCIAVMAALHARRKHGRGERIEVPLVDAGLSLYGDYFIFQEGLLGPLRSPTVRQPTEVPPQWKSLAYVPGGAEEEQERKLTEAMNAHYGRIFYETADGKKIFVTLAKPEYAERFYREVGVYGQIRREGYVNEGPWEDLGLEMNITGRLGVLDKPAKARLADLVAAIMKTRTAEVWEATLERAGVPFAVLRTRDEWLSIRALRDSGVFTQFSDGVTVPARVADMSGPNGVLRDPVPMEPEPSCAVEWPPRISAGGFDRPVSRRSGQVKRDLLKGIKVLDLCNIIAGPEASYNLAQYGADVIKVDPAKSNDYPNNLRVGLEVYQGKRSIILDMTTAPGREVFNRLVEWADIVIHNVLDDTAKRLGVTHDQLRGLNPHVISCQLSCFGGTWRDRSGWELRRGHDGDAQVPSGTMVHYGSMENPQFHAGLSNDVMTGLATAFSALLGIYQKNETGYSGEGRTSLARSTCFNQLPCMILKDGSANWGESRGQAAVGPHWSQRLYACRDGWIFVGASEQRKDRLVELITGERLSSQEPGFDWGSMLAEALRKRDRGLWQADLWQAGVGCHVVMNVDDLCSSGIRMVSNEPADETAACSAEVLCWVDHPCGQPVVCLAPNWVRIGEKHSYSRLAPAPRRGQHTREVLCDLGYSAEAISEMIRLRVAHEFLPPLGDVDAYFFEPEKRQ